MGEQAQATEFIAGLSRLGSVAEVLNAFGGFLRPYAVEHFALVELLNRDQPHGLRPPLHEVRSPRDWIARYVEQNYYPHDSVALAALARTEPFYWHELQPQARGVPAEIFLDARAFGMQDGFCVPVHRQGQPPGAVNLSLGFQSYGPAEEEALGRACRGAFAAIETLRGPERPAQRRLSSREKDVLSWIAAGKSAPEAADRLALSPHTARDYLRTAMRKLGASTQAQAVALGLRRGELCL